MLWIENRVESECFGPSISAILSTLAWFFKGDVRNVIFQKNEILKIDEN